MPNGRVWNSPTVKVNTVDLTDHADTATTSEQLDTVDVTTFGAKNKVIAPTLGDASITVDFMQDYASGKTHATLNAMLANSRNAIPGTVEIVPDSTVGVSANNPRITMVAYLTNYTGLDASVTNAGKTSATFVNAGTAGITYGTS